MIAGMERVLRNRPSLAGRAGCRELIPASIYQARAIRRRHSARPFEPHALRLPEEGLCPVHAPLTGAERAAGGPDFMEREGD